MTKNILKNPKADKPNVYFSSEIYLQIGTDIWVKEIQLLEDLELTGTTVNLLTYRKKLDSQKLALFSEEPLKNLYQLCKECNFEVPNYEYVKKNSQKVEIEQAVPQWAFLDVDCWNEVFFCCGINPDHFYVMMRKFNNL